MIKKILEEFHSGKISKNVYGEKMFQVHKILFQYMELLENSVVHKIEILADQVIIHIKIDTDIIKMKLDSVDAAAVPATALSMGSYEGEETDIALKILQMVGKSPVVFDVGANLGWFTLSVVSYKPDSKVYSFEPVKESFVRLIENLKLNNVDTEQAHNLGFYHENTEMDFYYDVTASGASSLADLREMSTTQVQRCSFKKIDTFVEVNGIKQLDFIKCDVEGAELFVFQGGLDTIRRFKPAIFSEMLRKWSAKFNYHPNDIISLLKDSGYRCFVVVENHLKEIFQVDEETIETNYFFLHKERHLRIIEGLAF